GLENLDPRQTYIIVSNHLSAVDFMINAYAYPGVYKFLAKSELVKVPLLGYIVRKMCVLVDRSSVASRSESMKSLKETLEDGYSVFLYPEGTRNRSAEPLLPFHKGAFRIALQSGYPIAVQTLVGIKKISGEAAGLDYSPGTVRVIWDKPIEMKGLEMRDLDGVVEQVKAILLKNLNYSNK
ncbi:MAG: lysophospholipid acyltransferase family protein, partial [Bacteroidota bacterium]